MNLRSKHYPDSLDKSEEAFWAAAEILHSRQAPGLAALIAYDMRAKLHIEVVSETPSFSTGTSIGCGAEMMPPPKTWPPRIEYTLAPNQSGTVFFKHKLVAYSWARRVRYSKPTTPSVTPKISKEERTLSMLASLLSRAELGVPYITEKAILWSDEQAYLARVSEERAAVHEKYDAIFGELVTAKRMSPKDAKNASNSLILWLKIKDCRGWGDYPALPDVPWKSGGSD